MLPYGVIKNIYRPGGMLFIECSVNQVEKATPNRVQFRSNLLAGFGAGFVTPVNTINFETVFDNLGQKIIDNVVVWATILAFILTYTPFAVLARHLDSKDAVKVQIGLPLLFEFLWHTLFIRTLLD